MEVLAEDLVKSYAGNRVVDLVTFAVPEGKTLVLLGTSGSGKTTCLRMLNRLVEPDGGQILIGVEDITQLSAVALRRKIGYVIQQVGLFPHLTVAENIEIVPQLLGWTKEKRRSRALELMSMLSLEESMADRKPAALSGGQQQRVGIARALAADPGLVLLDEPFGALDPITRHDIQQEFLRLPALRNKTKVMVTHDVQEAFRMGDVIALLDNGRVQQYGTPRELLFQGTTDFVNQFFDFQRIPLQMEVLSLGDLVHHAASQRQADKEYQAFAKEDSVGRVLEKWSQSGEGPQGISFELAGANYHFHDKESFLVSFNR
ncbi:MAG: ATP-binding cassette domain-containing protein, partial [Bacteroidota bacterium]